MTEDSTNKAASEHAAAGHVPIWLRLAVYIMGVLLIVMFIGLIGGIVWKATRGSPEAEPQALQDLGISGGDVKLLQIDGNTLALTTAKELVVIDLRKKAIILRSPLNP